MFLQNFFLNYYVYFLILIFFMGLLVFCSMRKHLLLTLLMLEYLVLVIFLSLSYFLMVFGYEGYFSLVYLTFAVCEGALGLGILVTLVRSHGNDNLSSISVMSW
uniref:NADH-ubiquinone oxidoreductase chain 4L n=1 Tax=Nepa hoffmanni TaxID=796936 RepID=A0A0U2L2C1_9HEMI|nr:NADH dehydrogenase subunit 4L [Nepa hoffmanni]ALG35808.1 NADH dehydrogenase subunit 4L [Nepa hoffmanni]